MSPRAGPAGEGLQAGGAEVGAAPSLDRLAAGAGDLPRTPPARRPFTGGSRRGGGRDEPPQPGEPCETFSRPQPAYEASL